MTPSFLLNSPMIDQATMQAHIERTRSAASHSYQPPLVTEAPKRMDDPYASGQIAPRRSPGRPRKYPGVLPHEIDPEAPPIFVGDVRGIAASIGRADPPPPPIPNLVGIAKTE